MNENYDNGFGNHDALGWVMVHARKTMPTQRPIVVMGDRLSPTWHEKCTLLRNKLLPIRIVHPTHNNLIECNIL